MLRKLLTGVRVSLPKAFTRTLSTTTTNVSSSSFSPSSPSYFPSQPAFGGGRLWGGAMLRKLLTGVRVSLPKALTRTLRTTTTSISSSSSPSSSPSQPAFAMNNVDRKNFGLFFSFFVRIHQEPSNMNEITSPKALLQVKFRRILLSLSQQRSSSTLGRIHSSVLLDFSTARFRVPTSAVHHPRRSFSSRRSPPPSSCPEEISDVSRAQETEVVQYFRSNDDYESADYYKDDKNMQGVEIILAMAPSAMALLLVGFLFAAAGIGDRSDQYVKKLSDDVPINSHDEQNFGGRSNQEVKKLSEDMPINSHHKQNFGGRSDPEVKKLLEDLPRNSHDELNFGGRSDQEVKELFEKWIVEHDKSYSDLTEKEKRFRIFKNSLVYIDQYNAGSHSHKLGLNHFADLTDEEFRSTCLGAIYKCC